MHSCHTNHEINEIRSGAGGGARAPVRLLCASQKVKQCTLASNGRAVRRPVRAVNGVSGRVRFSVLLGKDPDPGRRSEPGARSPRGGARGGRGMQPCQNP